MADDKVTTWRPDTCGCVISYSWDQSLSEDVRFHTAFCMFEPLQADNAIVLDVREGVCPAHVSLDVDPRTHPGNAQSLIRLAWHVTRATPFFDAILKENQAVQRTREATRKAIGAGPDDEFNFMYEFEGVGAERSLVVASTDLPPAAKAKVRAAAVLEFIPVTVA